jgi:predicted DNA-binding protein
MVERRKLYSFWIDPEVAERLKRLKVRTGQSESDQIRSAIAAWLDRAEKAARRARKESRTRKRRA